LKRYNDLTSNGISAGRISSRLPNTILDGQVSIVLTRFALSPSRLLGDNRTQHAKDEFLIKIYNDVTAEQTTLLREEKENVALATDSTTAEKGILLH